MSIKEKLLDALDFFVVSDLSEERLLDLLIDELRTQSKRICELQEENARERADLAARLDSANQDHQRMRSDPLYCAYGTYHFVDSDNQLFLLEVQGTPRLSRRKAGVQYLLVQISPVEAEQILKKDLPDKSK